MSQATMDLTRRYYETFNAHGIDGTRHLRHPEIEVHDPPDFPDADRHVGESAAMERVQSYLAVGWDGQVNVEEYIDAGDEVIVVWRLEGQTPLEDMPLDTTFAHVCLFEGGQLRRIRQYLTRAEAVEAAGLRE